MNLTRRTFLGAAAACLPALSAAAMPKRALGRTGARVSILAFGCGSRFLQYKEEDDAIAAVHHALDLGITYFDTAADYGDGLSEQRLGKALHGRREGVWVATKVDERDGDAAMRTVDRSLNNLRDGVDLVHIHSLGSPDDLAAIEAKGNVLDRLLKLRDQKVIRAVGISCHTDPSVLRTALERHDFDCTQMALNAARQGMAHLDTDPHGSFETLALPVANRKNLGVIAMKVLAQDRLAGKAPTAQLMRYSLSLPVSAIVVGMPKMEHITENAAAAKSFAVMTPEELKQMSTELSGAYKAEIDQHFREHRDA